MSSFHIEKARKLKSEGHSYEKIRIYLGNAGVSDDLISSIFRKLDNEEIDRLYKKQKLSTAKNQLIVGLIFFTIGLAFNVYRIGNNDSIDTISILIPASLLIGFYTNYRIIKSKTYSAYKIMKEEKRLKQER